jgi:hypothetical protein
VNLNLGDESPHSYSSVAQTPTHISTTPSISPCHRESESRI